MCFLIIFLDFSASPINPHQNTEFESLQKGQHIMKKHFKLYLVIVLIIALFSTQAYAVNSSDFDKEALAKIDASLLDHMNEVGEDELIPISISLKSLDQSSLMKKVKAETGMDPDVYMNEERFEKEVAEKIRNSLEKRLGHETAYKTAVGYTESVQLSANVQREIRSAFSHELKELNINPAKIIEFAQTDSSASIVDYAIIEARQQFQAGKNKVLKGEQTAFNSSFVSKYVEQRNNPVSYIGSYVSAIYIEATIADILYYAKQSEVGGIYYDDPNFVLVATLQEVSQQVHVDSVTGTKSSNYNNGAGFQGAGIKIGILEAKGVMDASSPHYNSSKMHTITNGSDSLNVAPHASLVTYIIAGKPVNFKGNLYSGVVPESEIYITRATDAYSFLKGLALLANCNVNIINISLGYNTSGYTHIDRVLDEFIDNTGITCVVAAGNNGDIYGECNDAVLSPGYALNCITVGNLETKTNGSSATSSPYSLRPSSSFAEPDYLPNKPDICAPGTWIRAVKSTTGTDNFYDDLNGSLTGGEPTGTSFAAPIVTGIVAQMMQEHSAKIGNPIAVKAKIINTANRSIISATNNPTQGCGFFFEKSGAGMVDAAKAMTGYGYKYAYNHYSVEPEYITQLTVTIPANQTLRATLAFSNKSKDTLIQSNKDFYDMDLRIVDAETGNSLYASTSIRNNVEIVEFKAQTTRKVYIQTRIYRNVTDVKTNWALEVDKY